MAQATHCLSPCDAGGNDGQPPSPKPRSYDFRSKRELNWDDIEIELNNLGARIEAVEMLGRSAIDSIHGAKMVEVFSLTADDLDAHVTRLKVLLGLSNGEEVQP
jgi:hypothetical protein